jgi:predicted MPP superfamily phosphohydrolase
MSRFVAVRSRDLSLWQSAVQEVTQNMAGLDPKLRERVRQAVDRHVTAEAAGKKIRPAVRRERGARLTLADLVSLSKYTFDKANREAKKASAKKPVKSKESSTTSDGVRKYSTDDWSYSGGGWAQCKWEYEKYYNVETQPKYVKWDERDPNQFVLPYTLPNNAKVVLIGDWGTNMQDNVSLLKTAIREHKPAAIVHLGDIYYSGTKSECQRNIVRAVSSIYKSLGRNRAPFFTIPGNHEYYSGGVGFYDMLTTLNDGINGCRQEASFFCLRTADNKWQFLGMDTGQDDCNPSDPVSDTLKEPKLRDSEIKWHVHKLKNFQGNTILLSHHQLFSCHDAINSSRYKRSTIINTHLYKTFRDYFNRISVWFWGHEHNQAYYEDGLFGLAKGRLVGCSAYEAQLAEYPYKVNYPAVKYADWMHPITPSPYPTQGVNYFNHGLAVIDFKREKPDDPITVNYYQYPSWEGFGPDVNTPPFPPLELLDTEKIGTPREGDLIPMWQGDEPLGTPEGFSGEFKSPLGPALASFPMAGSERLFMVYVGSNWMLHWAWFDEGAGKWKGNQPIQLGGKNAESDAQPAIAVYQQKLHVAFKRRNARDLIWAWFDGSRWQQIADGKIKIGSSDVQTDQGPALAAHNNRLYMAYVDATQKKLHLVQYDGNAWSAAGKGTGSPKSSRTPALASGHGKLYMLYRDDKSGLLWAHFQPRSTSYSGQAIAGMSTDATPWMTVFNDRIFAFCKTPGGGQTDIYQATVRAKVEGMGRMCEWSPIRPYTTHSGAVAVHPGGMTMIYRGEDARLYRADCVFMRSYRSDPPEFGPF